MNKRREGREERKREEGTKEKKERKREERKKERKKARKKKQYRTNKLWCVRVVGDPWTEIQDFLSHKLVVPRDSALIILSEISVPAFGMSQFQSILVHACLHQAG